jgi:hypothetical protein
MAFRGRLVVALVWIASLDAVAQFARAQTPMMNRLPSPIILSGSDIGFRVEGHMGNIPAGTLVIRLSGSCQRVQWPGASLRIALGGVSK